MVGFAMLRQGVQGAALSRHGMRCQCPVLFQPLHSCFQPTLCSAHDATARNGVLGRHNNTMARDVAAQAVKAREAAADQYDATRIQVGVVS